MSIQGRPEALVAARGRIGGGGCGASRGGERMPRASRGEERRRQGEATCARL